jgi:hypothetical protein
MMAIAARRSPNHSRKFAVLDAMVAVAAVAIGLALVRATAPAIENFWPSPYVEYLPRTRNSIVVHGLLSYTLPFIAA